MKLAIAKHEELYTVQEVGQRLKMTDKAVRSLIYKGQLRAIYLAGRRIRVTASQLDTFLREEIRPA
jgi:excisionase family DNA binding protein